MKFGAGAGTHDAEASSAQWISRDRRHDIARFTEQWMRKMNRQAATPNGFERRIRDLHFERVNDPRYAPNVDYKLPVILTVLVTAMVTAARSLRQVEQRTGQLIERNGPWQGLQTRIADNTFGKLIPRLELGELVKRLVGMTKAEHRRGNLAPTQLPVATAAIDGKNVATLRWHDLCRVLNLDSNTAKPKQVKKLLKKLDNSNRVS